MAEQRHVAIRLPLLYGGISHQPPHIRFANQVSDSNNFVFRVMDGAVKRPGTQYVATIANASLPNALGSGSVEPGPVGSAPATCTSSDHVSSYTVTWDVTGTDPDGAAISHLANTTALAQHSGLCVWSLASTVISNLTPVISLLLDITERTWDLTFLFVPATTQPVTLQATTVATSGADPNLGTYGDTSQFGESGSYLLIVDDISVAET